MDIRLECAKILGAGLATISLVGAGAVLVLFLDHF